MYCNIAASLFALQIRLESGCGVLVVAGLNMPFVQGLVVNLNERSITDSNSLEYQFEFF